MRSLQGEGLTGVGGWGAAGVRTLQAEGWKGLQREGPQREGAARGRSLQEEGVVPGRWPRGTPTTQGRRCPQKVILLSRPHRTRRSSRAAETGPGGEEAAQRGGWVGTGRPNARRWQRSGPRGPPSATACGPAPPGRSTHGNVGARAGETVPPGMRPVRQTTSSRRERSFPRDAGPTSARAGPGTPAPSWARLLAAEAGPAPRTLIWAGSCGFL